MPKLIIGFTDGKEIGYEGEDAINLLEALTIAEQQEYVMTPSVALSNGYTLHLALDNITRIAFKEEESK